MAEPRPVPPASPGRVVPRQYRPGGRLAWPPRRPGSVTKGPAARPRPPVGRRPAGIGPGPGPGRRARQPARRRGPGRQPGHPDRRRAGLVHGRAVRQRPARVTFTPRPCRRARGARPAGSAPPDRIQLQADLPGLGKLQDRQQFALLADQVTVAVHQLAGRITDAGLTVPEHDDWLALAAPPRRPRDRLSAGPFGAAVPRRPAGRADRRRSPDRARLRPGPGRRRPDPADEPRPGQDPG